MKALLLVCALLAAAACGPRKLQSHQEFLDTCVIENTLSQCEAIWDSVHKGQR